MKTFFSSKGFHRQVLINNPSIKLFQNLFPTQSYILFYFFFKKRKLFQFLFPFHVTVVSLYPRKIDSLSPNTLVCDLSNPLLFDFQKNLSKRYLCFLFDERGREGETDWPMERMIPISHHISQICDWPSSSSCHLPIPIREHTPRLLVTLQAVQFLFFHVVCRASLLSWWKTDFWRRKFWG